MVPGWRKLSGELSDNENIDLFSCLSSALFFNKHTTTYKYCFLKSILENIYLVDENYHLSFETLGKTFLTIYWNMINVHQFPQMVNYSTGARSFPERIVEEITSKYDYVKGVHFDSIDEKVKEEYLKKGIPEFRKYVIGAFYDDTSGMFYGFSKKSKDLWFNKRSYDFLVENRFLIDQVNYYEWLKMIERIFKANNVKRTENLSTIIEEITKRSDLTSFREFLRSKGNEMKCFYCGKPVNKCVHMDHFIPWDYLKSDLEWDFVFACPTCNSSKNNKLPDEEYLDKIIKRNEEYQIASPDIRKIYDNASKNGFKGGWRPKNHL